MVLTKEQQADMLEQAKPLIQWLNENCHPECELRVDHTTVTLMEGIAINRTEEFLKD